MRPPQPEAPLGLSLLGWVLPSLGKHQTSQGQGGALFSVPGFPKCNARVPIVPLLPQTGVTLFYPGLYLREVSRHVRATAEWTNAVAGRGGQRRLLWGHSLTLKVPVSGSMSQREKSVSRSPLLSIFR